MNQNPLYIREVIEGKNSVLFETNENYILYEKLANTIHSGNCNQLKTLQDEIESVDYCPIFEADSLKKRKTQKLESLLMNVTESCNFSCSYCIYSGKYENERIENCSNMKFETAKKAIDLFIPYSKEIVLIGFYGGEPLNNMGLIKEIISYIKETHSEKTAIFSMTSNFYEADKYVQDIIKNEMYVTVSLDGPKQIHDKNRRLKDSSPTYDKIIENIKKVEQISPGYTKTHFSYNATCKSQKDLFQIVRFFQENKQFVNSRINNVEFKGLTEEANNDSALNTFIFATEYLNLILSEEETGVLKTSFDRSLRNVALRSTETMPDYIMLNGSCYPGKKKLFVDTDGRLYICEKFGRRLSIGDVNCGINQEVVNKTIEKFLDIRNNSCKECWGQRLCTPCIQSAKDSQKEMSIEGLSQTCEFNKSQLLIALTNYVFLSEKNKKTLETYIKSIQVK